MENETFFKTNAFQSLFLDRDGVINRRIAGEYTHHPKDFFFLEGVLDALAILARKFTYIFVVTNQQGIGRGKMTEADLAAVHAYMLEKINAAGGRIDKIYHCPHLTEIGCNCRKPRTGMALQAQQDFPKVDFGRSVLVGDFPTDLLLAKNLGMQAVWLQTATDLTALQQQEAEKLADKSAKSLWEWAVQS